MCYLGPMLKASIVVLASAILLFSFHPPQGNLPEGAGKNIVEAECAKCHGLNLVTTAGFTRNDWRTVFTSMVKLSDVDAGIVLDYLATNFPAKRKPAAVIVRGAVNVSFKEWNAPSLGSRPTDAVATPDGDIWWTGTLANVIGRLKPDTGYMREFLLKTPGSNPQSLTADKDGNLWFTTASGGYLGKLDPAYDEVTEYKMPDPGARGTNTLIFDKKGMLWFTLQADNMVGRLDPQTGEIRLATAPTLGSAPDGLAIDSAGTLWFAESGVNKLASIEPNTMEIREYTLPDPSTRPRRLTITSDGVLWYSDYSRSYLGRFDPKTGAAREWPSPGGQGARPYGITTIQDVIWYSESATFPNALVRFDPRTEKFQTWAMPALGGVVRNVTPTSDGKLVMTYSNVNRVALATIATQ